MFVLNSLLEGLVTLSAELEVKRLPLLSFAGELVLMRWRKDVSIWIRVDLRIWYSKIYRGNGKFYKYQKVRITLLQSFVCFFSSLSLGKTQFLPSECPTGC